MFIIGYIINHIGVSRTAVLNRLLYIHRITIWCLLKLQIGLILGKNLRETDFASNLWNRVRWREQHFDTEGSRKILLQNIVTKGPKVFYNFDRYKKYNFQTCCFYDHYIYNKVDKNQIGLYNKYIPEVKQSGQEYTVICSFQSV